MTDYGLVVGLIAGVLIGGGAGYLLGWDAGFRTGAIREMVDRFRDDARRRRL